MVTKERRGHETLTKTGTPGRFSKGTNIQTKDEQEVDMATVEEQSEVVRSRDNQVP